METDTQVETTEESVTPPVVEESTETTETSGISESEPEKVETEEVETDEGEKTAESEPVKGKSAKKRIGQLTKEVYELQEKLKQYEQPEAPKLDDEPKEDDFEDYDAYQKAHTAWIVKKTITDERFAEQEKVRIQSLERQRQVRSEAFDNRAAIYKEEVPDFDEVAKSPEMVEFYSKYARHLAEAVESSEKGPEIAYYLGNNPDVAIDLAKLSPIQTAIEIGKLETKLSVTPKPKAVSKAPEPITPVGGSDSVMDKDPAEMTQEEFIKWRRGFISQRHK